MKTHSKAWYQSYHDHPEDENFIPQIGDIALLEEDGVTEPPSLKDKIISSLQRTKDWIVSAINPPLMGGILALTFGLIPWFHKELFGSGFLSPYVVDLVSSWCI